ncbi:MAG: histidine kinase [Bacteroidales bacterium]|nr:histidine kinase [Bacteroidales bacterium]
MRNKILNIRIIEFFVFVVIWMAVFSIPFFNQRFGNTINWGKVFGEWISMFSFLLIFVLNTLWLVPKFLFQKKYRSYVGITLIAILLVIGATILIKMYIIPPQPLVMPPMNLGPGMPPMELGPGMPPPMGYNPVTAPASKSLFMIFVDNLLLSILVVGAGTAFKLVSQWLNEESKRKDLEKEQLKTELALLRHQVSPHFFMNTLNNIHALIDINAEDAKNTIIQLSVMMRYLLYDTAHGQTTLKKEIAFIESYITLMKLRFPENVTITLEVPEDIRDIEIPPMLFISFLENSFKHGVSYQAESFVLFKIAQNGNKLNCSIRNSKFKSKEKDEKSYSGIGLTNIKKSLELLFKNDYILNIRESEKEYEVHLTIPVYENKMHSN